MKTKIVVLLALLMIFGMSLTACTPHTDYFDLFRGAFTAEVEGELNGVAFSAQLEAGAPPADGAAREVTVTFYAPEGLKGTVARRTADGQTLLSAGDVVIENARAEGLSALFDLFPLAGEVSEVILTEEEHTKVTGDGFSLTFLPDGTPFAVESPTVTARVVRFERQ